MLIAEAGELLGRGKSVFFSPKQDKEYTFKCPGKDERKEKCILSSENRVKSTLSIASARMSERKSVFFSPKQDKEYTDWIIKRKPRR